MLGIMGAYLFVNVPFFSFFFARPEALDLQLYVVTGGARGYHSLPARCGDDDGLTRKYSEVGTEDESTCVRIKIIQSFPPLFAENSKIIHDQQQTDCLKRTSSFDLHLHPNSYELPGRKGGTGVTELVR